MMVLLLFFCSGATALVVQLVLGKHLTLLLGNSVQAQTVVLAAFMGGLALGHRAFGPIADRALRPLTWFGALEILIGFYAFFFGSIHSWIDGWFVGIATSRLGAQAGLLAVQAILGAGLLVGPAMLMGGTFPLVAGWLQQRYPEAGRLSARFYSIQSFGAVLGAALAGFVLVRQFGMVTTLQMTALVNGVIGLTALVLSRFDRVPRGEDGTAASGSGMDLSEAPAGRSVLATACFLVAVTGAVLMGFEVLIARLLALVVGASFQALVLVLIACVLGISAGSWVVAAPGFRRLSWTSTTIAFLLAAAIWVGGLVLGIGHWVEGYRQLHTGLTRTATGYYLHQILVLALLIGVLGVPAALIGGILPNCIRALGGHEGQLGRRVGRFLAWNILGAVAGALLTAWVLMPRVGLRSAFLAMVMVLGATALVLAFARRQGPAAILVLVVVGALLWRSRGTDEGWRLTFSTGVFHLQEEQSASGTTAKRREQGRLLFHKDAVEATVSVELQALETSSASNLTLWINGERAGSTSVDLSSHYLAAHLPLLSRPEARDVLVLGLGTGATAGALLRHPVERVVVAEDRDSVIAAAELFSSVNSGLFGDARTAILKQDTRTALRLSHQQFDVIIHEPPVPTMLDAGALFSQEFYALCAGRLKPDGLMAQWFHADEMDDDLVALILRTFSRAFPHLEIWDMNRGDVLLLGSRQPWTSGVDRFEGGFEREGVRKQLESLGLRHPAAVFARQLASQRTAFAIAGPGTTESDNLPTLEYDAPKAHYVRTSARLLSRFDERLGQSFLAPVEKREALAALGHGATLEIFNPYSSWLDELGTHLASHAPEPSPTNRHAQPCIFRPAEWEATPPEVGETDSADLRHLAEAERRIRVNGEDWWRGVNDLLTVLRERPTPVTGESVSFPVLRYARLATTSALQHKEAALALEVLREAERLREQHPELKYLQRIAEREAAPSSPSSRTP